MHIVYAVLWLTDDALFSEQRKGVAPVEREGAGYTDALFWGKTAVSAMEEKTPFVHVGCG